MFPSLVLLSVVFVGAAQACTGIINSLSDVAAAVECTNININSFTVPPATAFTLDLMPGTVVNLKGNVFFGNESWSGPMFTINGSGIIFDGNNHKFDGGGPFYWDGLGGKGPVTKPEMMKIKMSGTLKNLKVVNSPGRAFSIGNSAPILIDRITVDNSQGDLPNWQSHGRPAGHNTDGFDIGANHVTVQNCLVINQDDCFAVNKGSDIVIRKNTCSNGHGISLGSISSDAIVSDVLISRNTIKNSMQALRIKTDATAEGSMVSNITYSGNTAIGMKDYGVIIDQSYPATLGQPGAGVKIANINFVGPTNTISVNTGAKRVAVNCGVGSCIGEWNWSSLRMSGGVPGPMKNLNGLSGYND